MSPRSHQTRGVRKTKYNIISVRPARPAAEEGQGEKDKEKKY
jgi:hypothetical protein